MFAGILDTPVQNTSEHIGNIAKRRILRRWLEENKARQIFR